MKRSWALALSGIVAAGVLSACSTAPDEKEEVDEQAGRLVRISIDADDEYQAVLAEAYARAMRHYDYVVDIEPTDTKTPRLDRLKENTADFVVGCTGDFYHIAAPMDAEDFAAQIASDQDAIANISEETYARFMGIMPVGTVTTDPSSAMACESSQAPEELAQNVVPAFATGMLGRNAYTKVQDISRLMTTEFLDQMAEEVAATPEDERQETLERVVGEWTTLVGAI